MDDANVVLRRFLSTVSERILPKLSLLCLLNVARSLQPRAETLTLHLQCVHRSRSSKQTDDGTYTVTVYRCVLTYLACNSFEYLSKHTLKYGLCLHKGARVNLITVYYLLFLRACFKHVVDVI